MMARLLAFVALSAAAGTAQDFSSVEAILEEMQQRLGASATLVVSQNGRIVYSRSTGTWSASRAINIASASKWLSGAVLMTLVDRGELSLGDPVSKFLPHAAGAAGSTTVRQLFSMTSGHGRSEPPCLSDRTTTLAICADQIIAAPLAIPPGTGFIYASTGMQLAARLAEIATGKRWADLVRERLTEPLRMSSTRVSLLNQEGNPLVAGGYVSSASDYLRFLQMVLDGGVFEGRRVLSARAVEEMLADQTDGVPIVFSPYRVTYEAIQSGLGDTRYGIGNWRQRVHNGVLEESSSTGAFGFTPWTDYSRNMTGVLSVLNDNSDVVPYFLRIRTALAAVVPASPLLRRDVASAATREAGHVAPGELVTIPVAEPARVTFDDLPARVEARATDRVTVTVPVELAGRVLTALRVDELPAISVPVSHAKPGLFTWTGNGDGLAIALEADGALHGPLHPARPGSTLTLFRTGVGPNRAGAIAVTIGGHDAEVRAVTASEDLPAGVAALTVLVPPTAPVGEARVRVASGGTWDRGGAVVLVRR
ncbi:MAG: serine hydrolase [Bryobacteraceae bacterium]|nr:serine hydrolase [Bryobacteraceae bacterium]